MMFPKARRLSILRKKIILVPLFSLLFILAFTFLNTSKTNPGKLFSAGITNVKSSSSDLSNPKNYDGLPVADVKSFSVSNPKGTVIYIPQYHKNPGSAFDDPKNDSAQKAQEEIYKILTFLHKKAGVGLIMMEGELFGEVPVDKIAFIQKKVEDNNALKNDVSRFEKGFSGKTLDQSAEKSLIDGLSKQIAKTDRDIILSGAPLALKIEDPDGNRDLILYGSEDLATQNKSADIVRDYVYLQDRMDQLNQISSRAVKSANTFVGASSLDNISRLPADSPWLKLLQMLVSQNPLGDQFRILESLASSKGYSDIITLLQKTEQDFNNLINQSSQVAPTAVSDRGRSRNDNPYGNITDKSQIENLMKEDEKKINEIVVDQRNKETAQNFADALKIERKDLGVLQFGAGHEKGLISELNRQGLSVIEVVSKEVNFRNLQG